MNVCRCSGCGQPVQNETIWVNLNSNEAFIHGKPLKITPKHAEMLNVLAKNAPNVVRTGELITAIWGHFDSSNQDNTLKVYVSLLRKKLRPFGVDIKSTWGRGYSLHETAPLAVAAE